ncbi:MAG: YggS family pyridoxal phosphate-dependent enzyme [Cytophagales bacterium]|nr:MAG: YggS family pyridoxal phosphate-dependent enzyme [Cytophagales bacterium]TAF59571.1 MAG: YggS family pyridoxal phosphate-dependent enzyme [Cytophagales bacterium]
MFNSEKYQSVLAQVSKYQARLVVVSKTQPIESLKAAHAAGVRVMAENRVQELLSRYEALPKDIEWHLIGHLQTNKVKYIAPFVACIHSVDSLGLLQEINKRATQHQRVIPCLLQMHIAEEESKFGLNLTELEDLLQNPVLKTLSHVKIIGLMGMGTLTEDREKTHSEFRFLKQCYDRVRSMYHGQIFEWRELSMGMSGDFDLALAEGSTMVRVGSLLF